MQLKATLRRLINILSPNTSATKLRDDAPPPINLTNRDPDYYRAQMNILSPNTSAIRLRDDAPPPINLTNRDPDYYRAQLVILVSLVVVFRDILVQLYFLMQVQATLFKIPREYFNNSDVFRKTYLLGPEGKEVPHGHTDQQPLRLDGIDAEEFRCLLKAMIQM
jgi:hypothetical protein